MTWWAIALLVLSYIVIAGFIVGFLDYGFDDVENFFIGMFWPLAIFGLILYYFLFLPAKLVEFVKGKIKGDKNEN